MRSKKFWVDALERCGRAAVVAAGGVMFTNGTLNQHINFAVVLSVAASAAVGSFVLSAIGTKTGTDPNSASLIK